MQRRRRQHEAERGKSRRDGLRQMLRTFCAQQHDRRLNAFERALLDGVDCAVATDNGKIPRHQREGLCVTALQSAQARDGRKVGCVACEMIAAQSLDGDDVASRDKTSCNFDRVGAAGARRFRLA